MKSRFKHKKVLAQKDRGFIYWGAASWERQKEAV
jgi:hypothetical protein